MIVPPFKTAKFLVHRVESLSQQAELRALGRVIGATLLQSRFEGFQHISVNLSRNRQVLAHQPLKGCIAQTQYRRSLSSPYCGGTRLAGQYPHFTDRGYRLNLCKIDPLVCHDT
jgi:hypothetical protein